jgi:hypothetical protein
VTVVFTGTFSDAGEKRLLPTVTVLLPPLVGELGAVYPPHPVRKDTTPRPASNAHPRI